MEDRIRKHHTELVEFAEWLDRHGYLYPSTPLETLTEYWGCECSCGKADE